jgi:membrane protease YdiL (CAAX protease family)
LDPSPPPEAPTLPAPARPRLAAGFGFFAVLLALVLVEVPAQVVNPALGLAWSQVFAMLLPAWIAAEGSNLRAARYLGLDRPRALPVVLGALIGLAGYLPAAALAGLWVGILPRQLVERFPDVARIFEGSIVVQVTVTVIAVGLAPICEEAAFRGYLQRTLARAVGPAAAIGIGALLFALRHLDPLRFAPIVFLGALFGWLAWRGGSLWPAIAAHAANNAVASATALAGAGEGRPDAGPHVGTLLAILLAGGTLVAALAIAYRRATPPPAPADAAVELRDASDPSTRFHPRRVPELLVRAALLGVAALFALALGSALWERATGP